MMGRSVAAILVCVLSGSQLFAQGHGPVFGLSTPTLRRGGWSVDNGLMGQLSDTHEMVMFRPMISYGITEHLQISASFPLPLYTSEGMAPARVATRMPASPDVELTLGWRFQARELGVGSRYESTVFVALDYPTDDLRMGAHTAPGAMAALATGYVSRTVYAWVGALHRRYMSPIGATADHVGDVSMVSAVVGLRPPSMQHEYPRPDWRVFVEGVGEITQRTEVGGVPMGSSGGRQYFVGPTLLGLYRGWGVSGGPVFPVYQRLNGTQQRDKVRLAFDVVAWF